MKHLVAPLLVSLSFSPVIVLFLPALLLAENPKEIALPKPVVAGQRPLEEVIKARRTVRSFRGDTLTLARLSQLLWAAYGITSETGGLKSVPSAGALYPLDIWVAVADKGVQGLEAGVYHYVPEGHKIALARAGETRKLIARASLDQGWIAEAPVILVITGEYGRCTRKYGERGIRYTLIEAGHAGQNIFLQAEALGMGAGIVGAFHHDLLQEALGIGRMHDPILVMPVGYKQDKGER